MMGLLNTRRSDRMWGGADILPPPPTAGTQASSGELDQQLTWAEDPEARWSVPEGANPPASVPPTAKDPLVALFRQMAAPKASQPGQPVPDSPIKSRKVSPIALVIAVFVLLSMLRSCGSLLQG